MNNAANIVATVKVLSKKCHSLKFEADAVGSQAFFSVSNNARALTVQRLVVDAASSVGVDLEAIFARKLENGTYLVVATIL